MVLTVLAAWLVLAALAAIFVAALGRSGLREDLAAGHLATDTGTPIPQAEDAGAAQGPRELSVASRS